MESESKTAACLSTWSVAAQSKDGDLAVTEVGSVDVAIPKRYHRDQPGPEGSVRQQDQAASKAEVSEAASLAHAVASEAASVATEEASAVEAVSAIKVGVVLEGGVATAVNLTALAVARHHLQMPRPVQEAAAAVVLGLVGMAEVRMVAHL